MTQPKPIDQIRGWAKWIQDHTLTVVVHPERAAQVRAAFDGVPLVQVAESEFLPDPATAYVLSPAGLLDPGGRL